MAMAKSLKSAAKEAKQRLKSRFWEDYRKEVEMGVKIAEKEGFATSGVEKYFRNVAVRTINKPAESDEEFYNNVKQMLDEEGSRPSNALDRLMDKKHFYSLDYCQRERYLFRLSDKYLQCLVRYDDERGIEKRLALKD